MLQHFHERKESNKCTDTCNCQEIDPRVEERNDLEPLEVLKEMTLEEMDATKVVKVGKNLSKKAK